MARPYSQEELLRLRESPLVHKPPGLPPVEEWMGWVLVAIMSEVFGLTVS